MTTTLTLEDLHDCFEGAVPAVIATAAADGMPNVTYLSRIRRVDAERVALSNQFFSKTARNLAENPHASVLVIDPTTYDEFRLTLAYERTDRRGPVFDRLREDVELVAAFTGMQGVFKLRAADVYRVLDIEQLRGDPLERRDAGAGAGAAARQVDVAAVAELAARLSRCADLDTLVDVTVRGLAELFGYEHSLLMLLDAAGTTLYTIASHGFPAQGVGSEVRVGDGILGVAASRCAPVTVGSVRQFEKYSRTVRRSFEDTGTIAPADEIPVPGLDRAESRLVVPAMALGQLIGVLAVESPEQVAFGPADEAVLTVVASLAANAIEVERARERAADVAVTASDDEPLRDNASVPPTHVRFFPADGSTFIDGDYLIKGVAGRLLWALLGHYEREGRVEFTNREVRLDPALELPEFRDNFESRLILLKRRLEERSAPIAIEKTGRGRFRLVVHRPLRCDSGPLAAE